MHFIGPILIGFVVCLCKSHYAGDNNPMGGGSSRLYKTLGGVALAIALAKMANSIKQPFTLL